MESVEFVGQVKNIYDASILYCQYFAVVLDWLETVRSVIFTRNYVVFFLYDTLKISEIKMSSEINTDFFQYMIFPAIHFFV